MKSFKQFISEEGNKLKDPPAVLIMKRKAIRQFPNNQKVALYYVDKIDKYVTVPYGNGLLTATDDKKLNRTRNGQ